MNTSKRMTLLAISAMLVLAACGNNNDENNNNTTPPANNNTAANNMTSNNMTSNNMTSNNMTSNNMTSNNMTSNNMTANNTTSPPVMENLAAAPSADGAVDVAGTQTYTITGALPDQAYRITLVVDGNITVASGAGTFIDNDDNGAADAGASQDIALITSVNGTEQGGAKTVPGGDVDPASPSGVFPSDAGEITLTVTGVGEGTIYPVVYHNGGASTFLEIDSSGAPTEIHVVAGAVTVQ